MLLIQISASPEWEAVCNILNVSETEIHYEKYLPWFDREIAGRICRFFMGGSTKTRSAAACQLAIDRWDPSLLILAGTCGGTDPSLKPLSLLLAVRTVQYDLVDRIGHQSKPFDFYPSLAVAIDTAWIPEKVRAALFTEGLLVTGDQDVTMNEAVPLAARGAAGADWESGAVAWVCDANKIRFCIIRGISDSPFFPEEGDYYTNTPLVMRRIITEALPAILMAPH